MVNPYIQSVEIYDTTLRDGTQQSGINLSLEEKILITQKLDELGVDFIEGGLSLIHISEPTRPY